MHYAKNIGLMFAVFLSSVLAFAADGNAQTADTIYRGGDILTMEGKSPKYVARLAVKDGKILFVGSASGSRKFIGKDTVVGGLNGRTLLPGFIDGHGHMIQFGKNLIDADLVGTPDITDLLARMKAHVAKTPPGAWIVGFGYNAKKMREARTPTIDELNQVSSDRPVMIVDSSGHLGAGNSTLFNLAGISAATPDPEGGTFSRKPGSTELLGPMEETALNAVRVRRPPFTGALADSVATGGAAAWARYGHTTAQECGVGLGNDDIDIVRNAIEKQLLPIDLYVCAKDSVTDDVINAAYAVDKAYNKTPEGTSDKLLAARPDLNKRYINRVRLGGIKFWLDGSIDTAWFTKPYTVNPPGKTGAYTGYRQIPDDVLDAAFDKYWTTNLQLNMHMNGDAAADQALNAIEKAIKKHGMSNHRPVFIHATYLRPDQIARIKAVGAIPSFLTASLPPAGDFVLKLWGPDRAARSIAAKTFLKAGLPFSFSHDAPVSPIPSVVGLVDAGVNRMSASGIVVGADERISPYDALRAVTSMAAYQIKEEKSKGTLEVGKLADLVILDQNPLRVEKTSIKSIKVFETIKEGKTVFRRSEP
ncbi:MAG: amidohydrolase [Hyphomicrobiales bacterium]|nr:amidohydrolase [Hyphomicrobiales bacterium]